LAEVTTVDAASVATLVADVAALRSTLLDLSVEETVFPTLEAPSRSNWDVPRTTDRAND
jgi:hypothetical protein